MTNTFSKMEGAPMHFDIEECVTDFKTIKVQLDCLPVRHWDLVGAAS